MSRPYLRVKWTEPDVEKQRAADERLQLRRKVRRQLNPRDDGGPAPEDYKDPDLHAVIEHTGMLLTEPVYVPGGLEPMEIKGSLPARHTRVVKSAWRCLVATESRVIEMDPLQLVVLGVHGTES